jgi:NADH-quinone oxidoreductase subunit J
LILAASFPDALTFSVSAVTIVVSAIGVVTSRNTVHSALYLVAALFGVAVLFVEEQAEFLAAVQVIVYAGAIVILFLFVIMLLGVDRTEATSKDPLPAQVPLAAVLGLVTLAEILLLAHAKWDTGVATANGPVGNEGSNVADIARSVFTTYLLPFEVTSILLIIAVIGAVVLARRSGPAQRSGRTGRSADASGPSLGSSPTVIGSEQSVEMSDEDGQVASEPADGATTESDQVEVSQ